MSIVMVATATMASLASQSTGTETAVETPWCAVCRCSSTVRWKKHVFTRKHQQSAAAFLAQRVEKFQAQCASAKPSTATIKHWCAFCSVDIVEWQAFVDHFSSPEHAQVVTAFCVHHRCDADKTQRTHLVLNDVARRQLVAPTTTDVAVADEQPCAQEQPLQDPMRAARVEEFLSSAASRLEVESEDGILQHPLGRHEGHRVWGGGIVKVRKNDWIPWGIDALVNEEIRSATASAAAGETMVHRVTERVRGDGLTAINQVEWGRGIGNVHTAAVPPWMVESEEEYKQCNRRELPQPSPVPEPTSTPLPRNTQTAAVSAPKHDIFSKLKPSYGPDWLPNFGSVWQEGARSKTKAAFQQKQRQNGAIGTKSERHGRQQSAVAIAAAPSELSASNDVPGVVVRLSAMYQFDGIVLIIVLTDRLFSPLQDAKKAALLAQKARLRAKLAAKRNR
ncbi:TPA: hypothetical protein N0F65_000211 [Lagenidium giganteum]|uniref:Uncharacterized protein n=1 Tax=Lagenidium giganteum TaxID=4803 RepID=A0AAV2YG68_9STRA|nr:TPA: hypothetical protein N0F65_000211 [Lagenidium giganteum]